MRIATYNVEWFNHLFDDEGRLRDDGAWSRRRDIRRSEQIAALGHVFQALEADAIMVIEAPDQNRRRSTVRALEGFAARFGLRARKAMIGFPNHTEQEIALLYDPDKLAAVHDPLEGTEAPRFDGEFAIDLDIDAEPDVVTWSKPPFELRLETALSAFRMIGVHAKSKAPHGARNKEEALRLSIAARRKQLAQCIWLRRRVEAHLDAGEPLIVLGDLNDGPGLDEFEALFGRSGVEIVLGEDRPADRRLFDPHARQALSARIAAAPSTARFYLSSERRFLNALLDYIMISPDLRDRAPAWQIWHPFDRPEIYRNAPLRDALLTASDHFPVSLEIDL